jgi:hypothetical protein
VNGERRTAESPALSSPGKSEDEYEDEYEYDPGTKEIGEERRLGCHGANAER